MISINTHGISYKIRKHQKSKKSKYLELNFFLKRKSVLSQNVVFTIDVKDAFYVLDDINILTTQNIKFLNLLQYIQPSKYSESQEKQVKSISQLVDNSSNSLSGK